MAAAKEFVLEALNSGVTAQTVGTIAKLATQDLQQDATAVIEVNTDAMKAVFKFQSDAIDVNTVADATDVTYWLEAFPANYKLNPCHAMMDHTTVSEGAIATGYAANKMLVKHDFVRHIAKEAFGTHHGVDLFENEGAMTCDLAEGGANLFSPTVLAGLGRSNAAGSNVVALALAAAGTEAARLNSSHNTNTNLSRQLMLQIAEQDPIRYATLTDTSGVQSVPLMDGDSINALLTLTCESTQYSSTSGAANKTAANTARKYRIKLLCVSGDPANTQPADSEPLDTTGPIFNNTWVRA